MTQGAELGREERPRRGKKFLWLTLVLALVAAAVLTFRVGGTPKIEIRADLPGIGKATPFTVTVEEPKRGLSKVVVEFSQAELVEEIVSKIYEPRPAWKFWGPITSTDQIPFVVGSEVIAGLRSGEATVRVSAWPAPTWARHPGPRIEEITLPVRLSPPTIQVRSTQHYVSQGGSGVVVYRVGETSVRDGVAVGEWWFPGYSLPGQDNQVRFALFGVPFDLTEPGPIRLEAFDDVGNQAVVSFVDQYFKKAFRTDTINVDDRFLQRVVPAIVAATPEFEEQGGLLENYLWINGELRARNAETLVELAEQSRRDFLWRKSFLPMASGQVMSSFADRRTYLYGGKEVDHQDHLGFDLASVRHAELEAANDGVVALARYFGIYGNAVVIDHGFGLMSLYGHLSSIDVSEGEAVDRGAVIGRSGETGLAGGDHLHFTLLIHGKPVTPVEWWDPAWIRDRFAAKLGDAFQFEQ